MVSINKGIRLKVKRSDWLDSELMRERDILDIEGKGKEIVCYVGGDLLLTIKEQRKKRYVSHYDIIDGVVNFARPFCVRECIKGSALHRYYYKYGRKRKG